MPNRLADATSPYLLQHKDNPVNWYQWSDEAFPILLYSKEHTSFNLVGVAPRFTHSPARWTSG